eukprot:CAMPEP_0119520946 /NCGR_PEP_ID=MMETSP1344-20130328/36807_1 /TAXON_ID=236787 /ORGANISM="Florenciella parvula, Strain CCMP2471" /LENGTH=83 /DNA_ID=CAMNT_0007558877 /DNA_START=102 /DNA_END=350 /DNA_ORIENTATION=-
MLLRLSRGRKGRVECRHVPAEWSSDQCPPRPRYVWRVRVVDREHGLGHRAPCAAGLDICLTAMLAQELPVRPVRVGGPPSHNG